MAGVDKTNKPYGYLFTCTSGTAAATVAGAQIPKEQLVSIKSIICGGAATTDIVRVYDADLNIVFQGSALVGAQYMAQYDGARVAGLSVGMSGATTGWCIVITR